MSSAAFSIAKYTNRPPKWVSMAFHSLTPIGVCVCICVCEPLQHPQNDFFLKPIVIGGRFLVFNLSLPVVSFLHKLTLSSLLASLIDEQVDDSNCLHPLAHLEKCYSTHGGTLINYLYGLILKSICSLETFLCMT